MDIKILVASHKKAEMPEDSMYLPVHVGRALYPDVKDLIVSSNKS